MIWKEGIWKGGSTSIAADSRADADAAFATIIKGHHVPATSTFHCSQSIFSPMAPCRDHERELVYVSRSSRLSSPASGCHSHISFVLDMMSFGTARSSAVARH